MSFVDQHNVRVWQLKQTACRKGLNARNLHGCTRVGHVVLSLNDADVIDAVQAEAINGLGHERDARHTDEDQAASIETRASDLAEHLCLARAGRGRQ